MFYRVSSLIFNHFEILFQENTINMGFNVFTLYCWRYLYIGSLRLKKRTLVILIRVILLLLLFLILVLLILLLIVILVLLIIFSSTLYLLNLLVHPSIKQLFFSVDTTLKFLYFSQTQHLNSYFFRIFRRHNKSKIGLCRTDGQLSLFGFFLGTYRFVFFKILKIFN